MKEQILSLLPDPFPWSSLIHCYDTVESTNTLAKTMAADGAPHGTVLIAREQTAGKGRLGRRFSSPAAQGLYLSAILRYPCPARDLMHATCAAAVAMCDAVEAAAGFRPGIKWTNDLVMEGKKLGGILTELAFTPDGMLDFAVIGIGINCGKDTLALPPELQTFVGTINQFSRQYVSVSQLAAKVIAALYAMDQQLLTEKEAILHRYRRDCITLGREISICSGDTLRHGTALDIDSQGALIVSFPDGHREAVSAGEVSIRGMYGYV